MEISRPSSIKNKLARFLTVVCFFNFSGLNNGYAIVAQVESLDAVQSVAEAKNLVSEGVGILIPSQMVNAMHEGHRLMTQLALAVRSGAARMTHPEADPSIHEITGVTGKATSYAAHSGICFEAPAGIQTHRENYIQKDKENWTFSGRERMSGVTAHRRSQGGIFTSVKSVLTQKQRLMSHVQTVRNRHRVRIHYSSESDDPDFLSSLVCSAVLINIPAFYRDVSFLGEL